MKASGVTAIRFVCQTHNNVLQNIGNGRFVEPTSEPIPQMQTGGWMHLDLSEFGCPKATEDQIDICSFDVEVTDDDVS